MKRISIDDARRHVLEHTATLDAEQVDLDDALGRVLAEDAVAPNPVPPFDCSTMDGFALRAQDTSPAPARASSTTCRRAGAGLVSCARSAKPSIVEQSNGGTGFGATASSASTRPSASSRSTCSAPSVAVCSCTWRRASSIDIRFIAAPR